MRYIFQLGAMTFPVTPSKIEFKIRNQNQTMTLINEGEINLLKTPGLTEISFDALLPNQSYPFAVYPEGFVSGSYFLSHFETMKNASQAIDFSIIRDAGNENENFNQKVSLEEYTIKQDAERGSDYEVSIRLKQYKHYGTKILENFRNADGTLVLTAVTPRPARVIPKTYVSQEGDTLCIIAKKFYEDDLRWSEIYDLNRNTIELAAKTHGKEDSLHGSWLFPGTVLFLPGAQ